ncbi:MAG: tryptophan synthase subunit alpha [Candidatus Thermofonsia Clade 1 bacterium]|jgi:tryptophan synthase alpha chain|uniref:Tryptophan synthase alpha chain n=1 Tax=Candidatus Thermofonsia Clade 1 bacterium TaxID=2364210 RepID=A0A2M8PCQ5_9CHLR|nr:MAG: tryptophan synthase subunit alpha [Candidatus Thermofonsia Clade 1 bacterium]RMF52658.1 MAG: tryptophan synthase subunit alpha [Chloroflexota bacterium]
MAEVHSGLVAITQTFERAKSEGRATFMPFFTVGYPDRPTSLDVLQALVEAGADALEIGMPFSDPLADGPTIQHASQVALENGTRISHCIQAVRTLRERGVSVPLVMMGYLNPLLAYGLERFVSDAAEAGASGFIVPDLPPEEAEEFKALCAAHGLGFTPLIAPNSTPKRIAEVAEAARGFLYLVSVTGVTGARDTLPPDLTEYIARVRRTTALPLAVGFGISQPSQARQIAAHADGVIVASALIRLMEQEGLQAVYGLAKRLRAACVLQSEAADSQT